MFLLDGCWNKLKILRSNSITHTEEWKPHCIVPFVYDEAKRFYIDKKAVKDSVTGCDLEELQSKKRVIKMQKSNKPNENKYKDIALIDIEKLWKEEYLFEKKQVSKLCK